MAEHGGVQIREARAEEFDRIGELRVAAYRADGFLPCCGVPLWL